MYQFDVKIIKLAGCEEDIHRGIKDKKRNSRELLKRIHNTFLSDISQKQSTNRWCRFSVKIHETEFKSINTT
ncbi:hypothetical protein HZS_4714 [Henneguya salminicola]|nr:hypothetical protein HZS_4714 [Henneguya salminicola]